MPEPFTDTRDGLTVTVWMTTLGIWAYRGSRPGSRLYNSSVEAYNRIDAWNKAYDHILIEETLDREG